MEASVCHGCGSSVHANATVEKRSGGVSGLSNIPAKIKAGSNLL